jgi:hypothetical protein
MTTRSSLRSSLEELLKKALEEAQCRKSLGTPSEVRGGAVWEDPTGKLSGDLQTIQGPISFSDATPGESIPPDPQLDMPLSS